MEIGLKIVGVKVPYRRDLPAVDLSLCPNMPVQHALVIIIKFAALEGNSIFLRSTNWSRTVLSYVQCLINNLQSVRPKAIYAKRLSRPPTRAGSYYIRHLIPSNTCFSFPGSPVYPVSHISVSKHTRTSLPMHNHVSLSLFIS